MEPYGTVLTNGKLTECLICLDKNIVIGGK